MTGYDRFNFPMFDKVRDILNAKFGDEAWIFSPADHDRILLAKNKNWLPEESDSEGPWKKWSIEGAPDFRKMLGEDLAWIAKHATNMVMLPGWEYSSGANAEHALAKALKLQIDYYNE